MKTGKRKQDRKQDDNDNDNDNDRILKIRNALKSMLNEVNNSDDVKSGEIESGGKSSLNNTCKFKSKKLRRAMSLMKSIKDKKMVKPRRYELIISLLKSEISDIQ